MFGKLKKLVSGPSKREDGSLELRTDPRYNLVSMPLAQLRFSDSLVVQVIDLSYGGLGAVKVGGGEIPKRSEAKLSVLNRAIEVKVDFVHETSGILGFQFVHDDDKVFGFLREVLDSLRVGRSFEIDATEGSGDKKLTLSNPKEYASVTIESFDFDGTEKIKKIDLNFKTKKAKCKILFEENKFVFSTEGETLYKDALTSAVKVRREKDASRIGVLTLVGTKSKEHSTTLRLALETLVGHL